VRAAARVRVAPGEAPALWAAAGSAAAEAARWGDAESAWQLSTLAIEAALAGAPGAGGWLEVAAARALACGGGYLRPAVERWRAARGGAGEEAALRGWVGRGQY
jgi:hypothetical protein